MQPKLQTQIVLLFIYSSSLIRSQLLLKNPVLNNLEFMILLTILIRMWAKMNMILYKTCGLRLKGKVANHINYIQ